MPTSEVQHEFYREAIQALDQSRVPFLIGGAYALACYAGIERETKDIDVFVLPKDFTRVIQAFSSAGYQTKVRFSHWLGKAFKGDHVVDVIFSSGNGICQVDETWFQLAVEGKILDGLSVKLCPPEEMIWSKAFVMERERFDGADVAHILRSCARNMDWARLLRRFGSHWRVLLSHLILFGFIYPAERGKVPNWLLRELLRRLQNEMESTPLQERLCQGTLLSWSQYLIAVERWGYKDARHPPRGSLTAEETALLTAILHQGE